MQISVTQTQSMRYIHLVLSCILLHTACFSCNIQAQATSTLPVNPVQAQVNVLSFGAKGDGFTNDTDAINSAMSACTSRAIPNNGCILYFPAGVYVTTGLTLRS